jgi:DNA-binding MarR family transcriptional regulator
MYVFHEDGDGLTQAEISQILNLPKQTVNSSLKKMEASGIIWFQTDAYDRKKKRVFLTEEGRNQMRDLIEPLIKAETLAYASLGSETASLLKELCQRETEALSQYIRRII